ncbi:MAG: GAF domain-containing sensor histidine kinase [Chloroflexi bacterium]|nr:GAF domain-containing sensor histidine kinase [Chloroflexota bacterium]
MKTVIQVDWLLSNLRWLVLVAVGIVAAPQFLAPSGDSSPLLVIVLLGTAAAYNLAIMLLLAIGLWPRALPAITLMLDCLLVIAVFQASGRTTSPLVWMGLFPIITAALRFGWVTSVAVAAVLVASDATLIVAFDPDGLMHLVPLLGNGAFLISAAAATGLLGDRVRQIAVRETLAQRTAEEKKISGVRDRSKAIYQMASLVSATLNYQRVIDAALDLSMQGMQDLSRDAGQMVSAVLLFQDDQLHVSSARRLTPSDMKVILPAESGVLGEVSRTGNPQVLSDPFRDPELVQFVGFRTCRSLMCIPLRAGFENYGVFLYGHPRPDFFDAEHQQLLEAVVNQSVIALQNAQLYQSLLSEKERIVEVEEEARKKLARDLHDGPTQSVAAIAMRVNFARRLLDRDPRQAADELFKIEDLARRTTKEIRHMLFTLRPLILESQGLTAALKQLAEKMRETHSQNVIVESEPSAEERLELNQQGVLFYVAEEAVNNARKHAAAEHIWVRLKVKGDVFVFEIQDDGVGFNVGAVDASYEQRGSLGMVNMRERAALVNGAHHIESAEGKGTKITVLVPLTEEARERLRT